MRRRLLQLAAFVLCASSVWLYVPSRSRVTGGTVGSAVGYGPGLQTVLAETRRDLDAWLPGLTTTTTVPQRSRRAGSDGNTRAMAEQADSDIERLICSVFVEDCSTALRVAWCESRYDPTAENGQYRGIFQLGGHHRARAAALGYSWDQMFEAYPNVVVAHDLWREQGWSPWECA